MSASFRFSGFAEAEVVVLMVFFTLEGLASICSSFLVRRSTSNLGLAFLVRPEALMPSFSGETATDEDADDRLDTSDELVKTLIRLLPPVFLVLGTGKDLEVVAVVFVEHT